MEFEETRLEAKGTKKIRGQGQGQPFRGQTLMRPRTGMLEAKDTNASVLQQKNLFSGKHKKSGQEKKFPPISKILTIQKIVLSSSRGQGNFRGLEASKPRTLKCVFEDVLEAKDVLEDSTYASDYRFIRYTSRNDIDLTSD